MRAKSMVLLLIAGVCGLVASIGISQVLERKGDSSEIAMSQLFVAVTDIDIGAKLDASNVKLEKWPKDRLPEGAISKLEDLKDKFPRVRLYAGEPLLAAKLMDSSSGLDNSAKIPDGYRVVSVKVTMDEVVSGLVKPGDRVDVIVFLKKSQEIPKTMSHTILKDVRVFAINSETERTTGNNGEQIVAKTVSLLVKPNQVESVMLAAELGKLRLSLRRPNDTSPHEDEEGTDIETLLGDARRRVEEHKATPAEPHGGIYDLIRSTPDPAPIAAATTPEPAPAPVVPEPPKYRMMILSPTGTQHFHWHDPKDLPRSGAGNSPATGAGALPLAPLPDLVPPAVAPPEPAGGADTNTIEP